MTSPAFGKTLFALLLCLGSGSAAIAAVQNYDDFAARAATSGEGIFRVHRIDDRVYFEIPAAELGKPFLWLATVSAGQTGFATGGVQTPRQQVVYFERHDGRILVRRRDHRLRAREGTPAAAAVTASALPAIVAALDVVAAAPDGNVVVDAMPLLVGASSAIRDIQGAGSIDASRSWVGQARAFPRNVEVEVTATVSVSGRPGFRGSHASLQVHNSLLRLPDTPMRPRVADPRIGAYTTQEIRDFSSRDQVSRGIRYIKRFRLEKKDAAAIVSDPVEPIVFYIDRTVPDKWRPYVRRGVEAWLPAFEQAGFSNAIRAQDAPDPAEDPDWDPNDARYSVIRWLASTERNALGVNVSDPRSGEVLRGTVLLYHDALVNLRDWYFTMASAADPRAQTLPFPDDLMGELMVRLVAHEVGHTLALVHNRLGSSAYPVESYRDPEFVSEFGLTASIMDFARANYIAQPGDNVDTMVSRIGPYDRFAIEWMYRQFPGAPSPDEEMPLLDTIALRQATDRNLLFRQAGVVASAKSRDLGNDALAAATYGFRNLERIAGTLVEATVGSGNDEALLEHLYAATVEQAYTLLQFVAGDVGAVDFANLSPGGPLDLTLRPVPGERQRASLSFVVDYGFTVPDFLLSADLAARVGPARVLEIVTEWQSKLVSSLLFSAKLQPAMAATAVSGEDPYPVSRLYENVRRAAFPGLRDRRSAPDRFRRELQRALVGHLLQQANGTDYFADAELRVVAGAALRELQQELEAAGKRRHAGTDHYRDLARVISEGLASPGAGADSEWRRPRGTVERPQIS